MNEYSRFWPRAACRQRRLTTQSGHRVSIPNGHQKSLSWFSPKWRETVPPSYAAGAVVCISRSRKSQKPNDLRVLRSLRGDYFFNEDTVPPGTVPTNLRINPFRPTAQPW